MAHTRPVLVLLGPTASGKTAAVARIARALPIELISVDSALVFRDMNIGTAKPSAEEQALCPHHLIDIVSPEEAEAIKQAIKENSEGSLGVHYLRSRRAGAATFVAFDLVVPSKMTVRDAHVICDRLEMAVHNALPGTRVTIHVEPENEMAHGAAVEI